MPNINEFKIKVLKEHNEVMQDLFKVKSSLLGSMSYIEQKKRLAYLDEVNGIIDRINKDYMDKFGST